MAKTYYPFGGLAAAAAAGVLVAVGMLMLTMLVVADEPAGAAFPGQNGKIAFESNRDGNAEIYTMNPNGQGIDRLTNNPANDFFPAWQPLSPAPNPKPPNNTTAPKVLGTFPKANANGVAPTASLKATFSEKMRASSVTGKTFELFKKKGSTKKLSARVSYEAATKKATLDPTTSLRRGQPTRQW